MKPFLLFFVLLCIFSCKKTPDIVDVPLAPEFWGEASAEINGRLWTAHPACFIDRIDKKSIEVHLDSFNHGYLKEVLIMGFIPAHTGSYQVFKFDINSTMLYSHLGFWKDDEDLGLYSILESDSSSNQVTLESYDTLSQEIKGSFNLTYIVEERPYSYSPDIIRFRNGKFHGRLVEK